MAVVRCVVIALGLVVPTVSTAAMAALPSSPAVAKGHGRRASACCDADPGMCRGPTTTRSPRSRVLEVIRREGATARACLTMTTAMATVQFDLDDAGAPRHVVVREHVPDDVRRCLVAAVGAWRFDPAVAGRRAPISFRFERRARGG